MENKHNQWAETSLQIRESNINPINNLQDKKSPESMSKTSNKKDSDNNRGSTNDSRINSNETPIPLRDQTPSQMTSK